MKMIKRFCMLSSVLVSSIFVNAQQPTSPLERKIIEKALDNFEMYKSCITVADNQTRSDFLYLFKDESVPVYNDLLGITNKSDINVSDYLNEQKANVVAPIIKIRNVNRDKIWEDNGKWMIQLSFDKSLNYRNSCGINFNTETFYGKMFRESMILSYDKDKNECRIESITGKIESDRKLPEDFCVLKSTNDKDVRVTYKHRDGTREQVKFNSYGQMFLTSGHEKSQFVYGDNDVIVKTNYKPECRLMTLSFKSYKWRIKAHYDIGLGKALTVSNESFLEDKTFSSDVSSKSSSFGIDAGYIIPSKGKLKIGVFMGLGISSTSLDLSCQSDKYSYMADKSQDVDGDTYERIYDKINLSQTTKITEFSIPIYADIDWRFNQLFSLYVDLGLKLNLNMSTSAGEITGSAENVHGIYHDYGDLLLDYHWGYNGFAQVLDLKQARLDSEENVPVKKFAPDLMAGAGFRFNIPRTSLSLDLGLGYQKGLGDLISDSQNANTETYSGKLIYNRIDENLNSTEYVHNLAGSTGAVSRGFVKFNIGLIYRF